MNPDERARVLDDLRSSHSRLVVLTSGLTPAQWHFRESPDRWSIAENIEHLALFERFILYTIVSQLEQPADPGKMEDVAPKLSLVFGLAGTRHTRFSARELVRPSGRWHEPADLLAELWRARESSVAFASETQAGLHDHFFPHVAWGDLNCYQWLLLLGQHSLRHAHQIRQVMADPAFPAVLR